MDARWMPVLAAVVGVLGGVGGAIAGGSVANSGQEQGFEREQAAADQGLRREAYGNFLGTAQEVLATILAERPQDDINAVFIRLYVAEARVVLVTKNAEVKDAAVAVREALTANPSTELEEQEALTHYSETAESFLAVARDELKETA
jgi:hypothetical protein